MSAYQLPHASTYPSSVVSPQLPSLFTNYSASNLLHLQLAARNVDTKKSSINSSMQHTNMLAPPLNQPFTLPLMLFVHPTLVRATPDASTNPLLADSLDSLDDYVPPTLSQLHTNILPTILNNLPHMIAQVKVNKVGSLRGNRVGLARSSGFVFSYTFRETQPSYHMLTVSSTRIRQARVKRELQASNLASIAAASSSSASTSSAPHRLDYSLASHLSQFDLFASSHSRIELLPIPRSVARAPNHRDASEGAGFYSGMAFASYLVSKHTLYIRLMPTRRMIDRMNAERQAEAKRRIRVARRKQRQAAEITQFGPTPAKGASVIRDEEEIEESAGEAATDQPKADVAEPKSDSDSDFDLSPVPEEELHAAEEEPGKKRKSMRSTDADSIIKGGATKKSRLTADESTASSEADMSTELDASELEWLNSQL